MPGGDPRPVFAGVEGLYERPQEIDRAKGGRTSISHPTNRFAAAVIELALASGRTVEDLLIEFRTRQSPLYARLNKLGQAAVGGGAVPHRRRGVVRRRDAAGSPASTGAAPAGSSGPGRARHPVRRPGRAGLRPGPGVRLGLPHAGDRRRQRRPGPARRPFRSAARSSRSRRASSRAGRIHSAASRTCCPTRPWPGSSEPRCSGSTWPGPGPEVHLDGGDWLDRGAARATGLASCSRWWRCCSAPPSGGTSCSA
jgi:hypothetical protein